MSWPEAINLGSPTNWNAPLNRGLVAWWLCVPQRMGSRTLFDLSKRVSPGTSNDGTLTAMSVDDWMGNLARPGGWGCLNFDVGNSNAGQRVVTASTNLLSTSPYSIAMWVRSPVLATSAGGYWFSFGDISLIGLTQRDASGYIRFVADFNTTDLVAVSGTTLSANTWTHVVLTWTGGTDANVDTVFYLNGVDVGHYTGLETDAVGTEVSQASTTKLIGCGNWSSGEAKAYIDDVRCYGRVLTPSEALMLYDASRMGYQRELNRIRRMNLNSVAAPAGGSDGIIGGGVGSGAYILGS